MADEQDTKQCPYCGNEIKKVAKKCRFCGEMLDNTYEIPSFGGLSLDYLVLEREKSYYTAMLVIAIIVYVLLTVCTFGIALLYVLFMFLFFLMAEAMVNAYLKQNSVKITNEQFPDIYEKIVEMSKKLNLGKLPSVFISQSNGILNAMAKKFLSEDIVVINSDVLELAYEEGEDAVNFIIAHELAHVQRKHVEKTYYLFGAYIIPFLPLAYSRACELTCDRFAYALTNSSNAGLLLLLGGKKLYKKVNVSSFMRETSYEEGFWSWVTEILETHPHLSTRLKSLMGLR